MAARLGQPVSLAEVADAAGVSVRSLNRAFVSHRGVSPMRFLRLRRLDAANRALLEAEPDGLTVTEVALRCGFSHLGRFACAYRECFGESPSETLSVRMIATVVDETDSTASDTVTVFLLPVE